MQNNKLIDLTGRRFERLQVLSLAPRSKAGLLKWLCRCDCGTVLAIQGVNLKTGHSKSCGCLANELISKRSTTHGYSKGGKCHPVYSVWATMHARCSNPKHDQFHRYGGRGITVCARWNDFENFIADMGPRPLRASIERKDNNAGYSPKNCRWASPVEQIRNRRNTLLIDINGEKKPFASLIPSGMKYATVWRRLKLGWPVDKLFDPVV